MQEQGLPCAHTVAVSLKLDRSICHDQTLPCANVLLEMLMDVQDAYIKQDDHLFYELVLYVLLRQAIYFSR